jgi:hypothetical protein
MHKVVAVILFLGCLFIGGCAVNEHDMRSGSPLDGCKSFEGHYCDDRDYCRPYRGLPAISLWEFLTTQHEDDPWNLPSDKTVAIEQCTPTGFDAVLITAGTATARAHIAASYVDGFYYVNPGPVVRNNWLLINSIWNFSVGLGKDTSDGGLFVAARETALGFILIIPGGGNVSIAANASFLPAQTQTTALADKK